MKRLGGKLRFSTFLIVLTALVIPVSRANAVDGDEGKRPVAIQQTSSTIPTSEPDFNEFDLSTNCYSGQQPFLTGVVKDKAGNPLGKSRVIVKTIGWSQTALNFADAYSVQETKADGSYSVCSGYSSWSSVYEKVKADNMLMLVTAVPPSNTSATDTATTLTAINLSTVTSTELDASCIRAASVTTPCKANVQLMAPIIQATVKKEDYSGFSKAIVSLDFKFGPKWTALGEFETNNLGWFGFAGFTSSNSFRIRVMPPFCEFEDSSLCPYNDLGTASDNFTVTVTNGDPLTASAQWLGTSSNTRDLIIRKANFAGLLKSSDGNTLTDGVRLVATQVSPERYQEAWIYGGKFGLTLEDGTWTVEAKNVSDALMKDTSFTIGVTSGVVTSVTKGATTVCSIATTACTSSLNLPIDDPNFVGIIKDDQGNPVKGSWISVAKYTGASPSPWEGLPIYANSGDPSDQWNPRTAGLFGFNLPAPATLKIYASAPESGDSEVVSVEYIVKTTVDGTGIKVQRCAAYNGDPQIVPCQAGYSNPSIDDSSNTLAMVNGRRSIVMPTANFKGVACTPNSTSSCTTVGGGYVSFLKESASPCPNCLPFYNHVGIGAPIKESGNFSVQIQTEGKYRLELGTPRQRDGGSNTTLAKSTTDFEAVSNGSGGFDYFKLDASGNRTSQKLETIAIPDKGNRIFVKYVTPSLIGIVQAPDGTPNRYSGVEVQKDAATEQCSTCREFGSMANLDNNGTFAMALTVGRYFLASTPGPELASQSLTKTEFKLSALDCDANGSVELYTFESTQCTGAVLLPLQNGKVVITLLGANFAGTLRNPTTNAAVPYASLQVSKLVTSEYRPEEWQWTNMYSNTSQTGMFGLTFTTAGKYRVQFSPPQNLQSQFSPSFVVVDVSGSEPVTVTPVADADVWSADGTGKLNVKLSYPNVSGTISLPAGVSWPAFGTWIMFEKWYSSMCGNGCYSYSSEANGVSSSSTGAFAQNLPPGQWRMTVNPPYGAFGVSRLTREIVVTSQKHVCNLSDSTDDATKCPESTRIAPGNFNVTLPTPNFSGTVRNPGNPGSLSMWTQVQFFTWNSESNYWQWTNMSVSTDNNGRFGINLTDNMTYKVSFEAAWSATGVSAATRYVRVCDSGATVEFLDTEVLAKSGLSCMGSGTVLRDVAITLLGANMNGIVKDASGTGLADVWVSVQNCGAGAQGDWCTWERGVNTKNLAGASRGTFDIRLDNDSAVRKSLSTFLNSIHPGTVHLDLCASLARSGYVTLTATDQLIGVLPRITPLLMRAEHAARQRTG